VIRLKNKTDSHLRQVLINFVFEFDYPGLTFEHTGFGWTYTVQGGRKQWVGEMQLVLKDTTCTNEALHV